MSYPLVACSGHTQLTDKPRENWSRLTAGSSMAPNVHPVSQDSVAMSVCVSIRVCRYVSMCHEGELILMVAVHGESWDAKIWITAQRHENTKRS